MRDELNIVSRKSLQLGAALGLTFAVCSQAFALKAGHGRVDSLPGAPLQVSIPLLEVVAADVSSLRVKVASADAWAKSGLTPPVSLESVTVSIEPGFVKDSRSLVLRSTQPVNKPIVDVLLELSSASGSIQIQSSFLVLTRANEGVTGGSVLVKVGDTLSGIALANPVDGADLYQMLWALYQANPQAFFSQNMNLLKAGVTLNLPDAQTVRAIDSKLARDMYQVHLNAFKALRNSASATNAASRTTTVVVPAQSATQSSAVSTASSAPAPTAADRVMLTSASTAEQRDDARVAAAKEIAEIQSRVDSLQQNVKQLKDALNQAQSGATGSSATATGSTSAVETSGAVGTTGSAGTASVPSASATASSATPASESATTNVTSALRQLWSSFTSSALGILTAILAIGGLLVAWLLRRAGARREADEVEGSDMPEALNPFTRSALDQKLHGIDLNLEPTGAAEKKEPTIVQPNASPKA